MKIIERQHHIPYFSSNITDRYLSGLRLGVFDIETLGLNPQFAPVILAGFMTADTDGTCHITQYFAQTPSDECEIISRLAEDFLRVDYILTYNGRHFDIPYIQKRANKLSVSSPDANIHNMDLYLMINGYSEIKNILNRMRQKDIEIYMGLSDYRADTISGAESVQLYREYLGTMDMTRKSALEKNILLHNHDDIIQLYKLLPVLRQLKIHDAFNSLGFAVAGENGWPCLNISSIKVNVSGASISGRYRGESFSYLSYDNFTDNFSCEFDEENNFSFNVRIDRHKGNSFINLKRFFSTYDDLKTYPNYIKDYLLIGTNQKINSLETNMFVKKFLFEFMNNHVCPLMVL